MTSSTPHLLSFPSEIIVRILQHLDYVSVHSFELTCRQSHEIVHSHLPEMPKFITRSMAISFERRQLHNDSDENSGGIILVGRFGSRRFPSDSTTDVIRVVNRIQVMDRLTVYHVNTDILSVLTPVINGPDVSFFEVTRVFCETPVKALVPLMSKISCTKLQLCTTRSLYGTVLTLIEQMNFVQTLSIAECYGLTFDDACLAGIAAKSTKKIPVNLIIVDDTVTGEITAEGLAVFLETAHFDDFHAVVNVHTVVGVLHRDALIARLQLSLTYEDPNQYAMTAVYKDNVRLRITKFI